MRVACVDDDPMILRLVKTALERRLGAQVSAYTNSIVALDALREEEPPELGILDAMMPNLDGFSLCEALLQEWKGREPRIIFLTAGGPGHRERALKSGAFAALSKPFQPNELMREIARLCGEETA